MGVARIRIGLESSDIRFLNSCNDFLSSFFKILVFNKYELPKLNTHNHIVENNARSTNVLLNRVSCSLKRLIEVTSILLWKGRKWRGTYWPSKWKWYHRHGYWATRKKLLDFDKYRPYRYHEVKGYGKPKLKFWQDYSYYRPLKQTTKFW